MTSERDQYPIVPAPAIVPRQRFKLGLILVVMVACGLSIVVDLVDGSDLRPVSLAIRAGFFVLLGGFVLALTHSSGLWRLTPRR